jgi:hypothetical protein
MGRYQTKECSIKELNPKLRKIIKPYISDGEKILLCFETESKEDTRSTLSKVFDQFQGNKSFWEWVGPNTSSVLILTNRKVINASIGGYTSIDGRVTTINLDDISNVTEGTQYDYCQVTANVTNGIPANASFIGERKVEMSRKFSDAIRQEIQKIKTSSTSENSKGVEERLRALTNLYKEGLISEAEFQQKRKEIIGQL